MNTFTHGAAICFHKSNHNCHDYAWLGCCFVIWGLGWGLKGCRSFPGQSRAGCRMHTSASFNLIRVLLKEQQEQPVFARLSTPSMWLSWLSRNNPAFPFVPQLSLRNLMLILISGLVLSVSIPADILENFSSQLSCLLTLRQLSSSSPQPVPFPPKQEASNLTKVQTTHLDQSWPSTRQSFLLQNKPLLLTSCFLVFCFRIQLTPNLTEQVWTCAILTTALLINTYNLGHTQTQLLLHKHGVIIHAGKPPPRYSPNMLQYF